ncbi:hypothetical protein PUN28_006891 [Cardiocondyla obscurior]|uniref:Uncharacterized protein n=1 Tax=Cardiocondyla obscurior TaxID=286306 RepID=A0AAW2G2N3_9HYME
MLIGGWKIMVVGLNRINMIPTSNKRTECVHNLQLASSTRLKFYETSEQFSEQFEALQATRWKAELRHTFPYICNVTAA